jgi:hypothetical protein
MRFHERLIIIINQRDARNEPTPVIMVLHVSHIQYLLYDSSTYGSEELNRNAQGKIADHTDLSRFLSTIKINNNMQIHLKGFVTRNNKSG